METLELNSIISHDISKDTYLYIEKIFDIMFHKKRNKSLIIRFDNVSKNIQLGILKGQGYSFNSIYTIPDINNIDNNIPTELHNPIIQLHKLIDIIFNICFSSKKKVVYAGFYKKEHILIFNTRSNVKIKPMFKYDSLLYC